MTYFQRGRGDLEYGDPTDPHGYDGYDCEEDPYRPVGRLRGRDVFADAENDPKARMMVPPTMHTYDRTKEHDVERVEVVLTAEQQDVYDAVRQWTSCAGSGDILKVGGYAGSGKTTLLCALAYGVFGSDAAYVALSGKAVNVLRKKMRAAGVSEAVVHKNVSTIHSLIYYPIANSRGEITGWKKRKWEQVCASISYIVVDEASMVGETLLEDLQSFNLPILAVGDHGQLPPVKDKGVLMSRLDHELKQIHRQAAGNPILTLAHHIRSTGYFPEQIELSDHVQVITRAQVRDTLTDLYDRYGPNEVAVICYRNVTRHRWNTLARSVLLPEAKEVVEPGDQVICLKNHKVGVFNGMRGHIDRARPATCSPRWTEQDKVWWWNARVDFSDQAIALTAALFGPQFGRHTFGSFDEVRRIDAEDWQLQNVHTWGDVGLLFDYGYALTAHKAQGSEFRAVVLHIESLDMLDNDTYTRWMYTAVTRASEVLYLVE